MTPLKAIIHPIAASWVRHKRVYHGSAVSEGLLRGFGSTANGFEIGGVVITHTHRLETLGNLVDVQSLPRLAR